MFLILPFVVVACLLSHVYSFPSGAPLDRCGSMMPGHGVDPLNEQSPFYITVKPSISNSSLDGSLLINKLIGHLKTKIKISIETLI